MSEALAKNEPQPAAEAVEALSRDAPNGAAARSDGALDDLSTAAPVAVLDRPSTGPFSSLRDNQILQVVAFGDALIIAACAFASKLLYVDLYLGMSSESLPYATVGVMVAAIYYALMQRTESTGAQRLDLRSSLIRRMLVSLAIAFAVMLAIGYAMKLTGGYSRGWVLGWIGLSVLALILYFAATAAALRRLVGRGYFGTKVALLAERGYADEVREQLRLDPQTRLSVVFAFAPVYDANKPRDHAGLDRFIEMAQVQDVDRIVIALPSRRGASIAYLLERLEPVSAELTVYNAFLSGRRRPVSIVRSGAIDLVSIRQKPLGPWSHFGKSAFDRLAAALLAVLLALPMALIALAVRMETPGGALFVQRRHGLNNRVINVLKFRTMRVAEDGETIIQASKEDERVTRVGRFLRRTSLDELPQLVNVLRGEMSLVGPRPHALAHNYHYAKRLVRYANRHRVKPGITGWAQINGCRGNTTEPSLMRRRVEYDLYYIDNWSFWFDIKILLLTPFRGMIGENAY